MTTDRMPPHGEEIQANIKCARCGDVVKQGEVHVCKDKQSKEDKNEKPS